MAGIIIDDCPSNAEELYQKIGDYIMNGTK